MLLGSKIHGYHVELQAGAALNEEYIIVIAKPHELLDIGLGLIVDFVVLLRTMADLQNGHAAFTEIQEFRLGLLQHRQRQHGRSGIKVIDTICFQRKNPPYDPIFFPQVHMRYMYRSYSIS